MMMGAVVTVVVIIMYLRSGSSSQTYYKGVVRVLPLWDVYAKCRLRVALTILVCLLVQSTATVGGADTFEYKM